MTYKCYFAYRNTLFLLINGPKTFQYDRCTSSRTTSVFAFSISAAAACTACVSEEVTYILAPMGGWGVYAHNHMHFGNFTFILINFNVK